MKLTLSIAVLAFLSLGTWQEKVQQSTDNTLTPKEKKEGWKLLFDGRSSSGWRGFNQKGFPSNWTIESGCLKGLGKGGEMTGDLVFGKEEFENFELTLQWKIEQGGNSGIFYHVREGTKYQAAYENAPEYQVIDDIGFPEKLEPWQTAGADYAMYPPDTAKIVKPAGEWNESRIRFTPGKVEYWLNGALTASFVPWSDEWNARRVSGKWKDYPDYGKARTGMIGLQNHGSVVEYKNIKIRKL